MIPSHQRYRNFE